MEKKRKLPPRGASKAESSTKKRASTPPDNRSNTHTPTPAAGSGPQSGLASEMDLDEPSVVQQPEPLPTSIVPGKPLPTVEEPQPDDLPAKDFQSIQDSGVLAESLHRSRQRWISEGIFEKYWSKPRRRGGTYIEDPRNPSKDTMSKLGHVTIIVEPHIFEATMWGVKEVKPPPAAPTTQATFRPIVQYGPPNGVAPPPSGPTPTPPPSNNPTPPAAATATPAPSTSIPSTPAPHPPAASTPVQPLSRAPNLPASQPQQQPVPPKDITRSNSSPSPAPTQQPPIPSAPTAPHPPTATAPAPTPVPAQAAVLSPSLPGPLVAPAPTPSTNPANPVASPRGMEAVLSPSAAAPLPAHIPPSVPVGTQPPGVLPADRPPVGPMIHGPLPPGIPPPPTANRAVGPGSANTVAMPPGAAMPGPARPAAAHAPGADPIILTLAEKATEDPHLRDLMKRVANGQASRTELEGFQAIIDQITAESKRKGAVQGPSADRLVVDGRTVRYFADEVRAILDIVLASNPKQTSGDLRPPAGSDPLVVLLVKTALDDVKVRDMVRRIADNRPRFSDATDLKHVLDRLKNRVVRDQDRQRTQSPAVSGGLKAPNGAVPPMASAGPATTSISHPPSAQQALRSKGPPPVAKPDFSAVLFEFHGGTGDRYLFPKFSIVEMMPSQGQGQHLIASFIIVRRGSTSEHGGNPDLDYYQPITIRLLAPTHGHLGIIPRIVAPVEEVRSYMDDVMSHMTRAEYVLLAMRLPRKEKEDEAAGDKEQTSGSVTATATPNGELQARQVQPMQGVLWTTKAQVTPPCQKPAKKPLTEDEKYQRLITSLTPRETEEA